jgi:hypothetical protein
MLTGLGVGAGLMYFLDPERGRRRRALARDQMVHVAKRTTVFAGVTSRDMAHRTYGTFAKLNGKLRRGRVDDEVLVERVRARLGRVVSHPRAIDVIAGNGRVTLRGQVLQDELSGLLEAVGRVAGVRRVVNELQKHDEPRHVPALQGGSQRPERQREILQHWSTRTWMTGSSGLALAGYGLSRRTLPGAVCAAAGMGLLARAARRATPGSLTHGIPGA